MQNSIGFMSFYFRTAETKLMNELNKIAGQEQKLKELSAQDEELMKKVQAKGMELHEKQKELVKIKEDYRKRIHELNRFVLLLITFSLHRK